VKFLKRLRPRSGTDGGDKALRRPGGELRRRGLLAALGAPAAAILVFGVIYGSIARPLMGPGAAMLTSLLIFSGAVQFTIAALLSSGAGAGALVAGSVTLNFRNLLLGAVLRPRIETGSLQRAGLAWFLVDESTGLALASGTEAAKTLVTAGTAFYAAWQVGTVLGLLGASVEGVRSGAEAVFPVLFIGLAALSCPSRSLALRAGVAASLSAATAALWPGSRGLAAVAAAIAVSLPGGRQ
jgi:predicted branched-subunit amino acid permease